MMSSPASLSLRAKKLGVLMREARLASGKTIPDCGLAMGVSEETYEAYELGEKSPSLPEIEILAYTLDVPFEYFWGLQVASTEDGKKKKINSQQVISIRHRTIGVYLRQARLEAGLSLEDLAKKVGSTPETLDAYELGEQPIPVPELETIALELNHAILDFQDKHGPVGTWAVQQRGVREFLKLPLDLQSFVSKPINRPYIELAQRLSELDADKLRSVAEALLTITY